MHYDLCSSRPLYLTSVEGFKSQMKHISKHALILFFWTILVIDGEHWYSATMMDSVEVKRNRDEIKSNYDTDSDHRFTPMALLNPLKSLKKHNRHNLISTATEHFASEKNSEYAVPTYANKSINNTDTLVTHTRKRIIRKRCPSIHSRLTKQLYSKHKSNKRFLDVFQVVEFEHVPCSSDNGLDGTCLPEHECKSSGGSNMGSCADGYGTCCVTQFSCDGHSAAPMGWLSNPGFPLPSFERLSCTFSMDKASKYIKQIRLDFISFELLPPTGGSCQQDQFVISGQNVNNLIPILCGINTGQHVYIEVSDMDGPIYFSVQTVSPETRLYSIKIKQLTATDELAAPPGCLQYFRESESYLESFNYRDKSEIAIAKIPSYLNNLNYAMCIERATESCSLTYNIAGDMQIVNYDIDGLPVIPPNQAGVEIFNCPSDWLLIAATRLCGDRLNDGSVFQDFSLNAPVTDTGAGPIVVWFRSDEGYVGRGFKLQYQQNACRNPT